MMDMGKGISRHGLDAAFEAEETRKSGLILQASLLHEQGDDEAAAPKFAEAATIEERLRDQCRAQGLLPKSFVHAFSAAGCWARAGDSYHALTLCDEMLARTDLPDRLRARVGEYAATLRTRRSEWYMALLKTTAGVEG